MRTATHHPRPSKVKNGGSGGGEEGKWERKHRGRVWCSRWVGGSSGTTKKRSPPPPSRFLDLHDHCCGPKGGPSTPCHAQGLGSRSHRTPFPKSPNRELQFRRPMTPPPSPTFPRHQRGTSSAFSTFAKMRMKRRKGDGRMVTELDEHSSPLLHGDASPLPRGGT